MATKRKIKEKRPPKVVVPKEVLSERKIPNVKAFFREILSETGVISLKRFTSLTALVHFFIASFMILWLFGYLIFTPKTVLNLEALKVVGTIFTDILQYDMIIIGIGIFGMAVTTFGRFLVEKARFSQNPIVAGDLQNAGDVNVVTSPNNEKE